MRAKSERVEYLDSIRGLAALFVLLSHTLGAFDWPRQIINWTQWPFLNILVGGKEGVVMFFVLSGYVLSNPYVQPVAAGNAPRKLFLPSYFVRRITRIWLPWFAVLLLSMFSRRFLFHIPPSEPPVTIWLKFFWQAPMTAGDFLRQCIFSLHDASRQLLNQDWSLGVELKGSALIPMIIFLSAPRRIWTIPILITLLLLVPDTGRYYVTFVFGVLLARYGDFPQAWLRRQNRLVIALFILLGLSLYQAYFIFAKWHVFSSDEAIGIWGWLVSGVGCVFVLLWVKACPQAQAVLCCRPLVLLGKVSYSFYLLQFIIILCLLPQLISWLNHCPFHDHISQPVLLLATFIVSTAATFGLSTLTYRWVEIPSINLGHKLAAQLQKHYPSKNTTPSPVT